MSARVSLGTEKFPSLCLCIEPTAKLGTPLTAPTKLLGWPSLKRTPRKKRRQRGRGLR